MELNHLRTFSVVSHLQHLTQASERLHISQPTASAHIKALEQELGTELFERRRGRLALTSAGIELVAHARAVIVAADALKNRAREIVGTVRGTFKLGVRSDSSAVRLAALARTVVDLYPKIKLQLIQLSTRSIIGAVQAGDLDAGIALCGPLSEGLLGSDLERMVYCVVGPVHWKDIVAGGSAHDLLKLPWIGVPRGGSHDQMQIALFGGSVPPIQETIESDQEATHFALVEAGLGLALMREDLANAAEASGRLVQSRALKVESVLRYVRTQSRSGEPAIKALESLAVAAWQA